MAHDSVVDDGKSKIVTKFLLNTCRLTQPSIHHVYAATWRSIIGTQIGGGAMIPLTTGSVAEFYIQPMLSCVGDLDIMAYTNAMLAIPPGYPPPSQLPAEFYSWVLVREIFDTLYPGYVYLGSSYELRQNTDTDRYDAVNYRPDGMLLAENDTRLDARHQHNGPAFTITSSEGESLDLVHCIRCLSWPTQAADWPTRHRNYDWPDLATVDRVVSNGCDLVQVAHYLHKQDEWMKKHQWRLSFSRAEIVLLNSWMPVQQIVYHMLRVFVKTERLTDITDSTGTKILSNYHIKTLMLWACELKPRTWWSEDMNVVRMCVVLLHVLVDWLKNRNCPHYFVNNCNLIDTSLQVEIIISQLVSITESWLSMWFVNNYLQ